MSEKLKMAIIGLGHHATQDYLPSLAGVNLASLEAVCDPNDPKLDLWHQKTGARTYKTVESLLTTEKLDFVVITAPHDQHLKIIQLAASRGIHVYKEKPCALSLKDAMELISIEQAYNVFIATHLQRRASQIYYLGNHLKDHILNPFLIDIRYTLFVNNPHEGWRGKRERSGGGCLIDMGYHMIDVLIWLYGLPETVYACSSSKAIPHANYDTEDTALVSFNYKNGPYGNLLISRYCPPKTESIQILGSNGILEINKEPIRKFVSC